jgi:hypothetical protein
VDDPHHRPYRRGDLVLHSEGLVTTAPASVTLTCPVCGATEEATGQGSMDVSWQQQIGLTTRLNYNATVVHVCPEISNPLIP